MAYYKVATGRLERLRDFERTVQDLQSRGWTLVGGVSVSSGVLYQAMTTGESS